MLSTESKYIGCVRINKHQCAADMNSKQTYIFIIIVYYNKVAIIKGMVMQKL